MKIYNQTLVTNLMYYVALIFKNKNEKWKMKTIIKIARSTMQMLV